MQNVEDWHSELFKEVLQREFFDIPFIVENWRFKYRKTILQEMKDASESEKQAKMEDLILFNHFWRRLRRDLGLRWHVYSVIQKDIAFFRMLKQKKIRPIISRIEELDPETFRKDIQ